MTLNCQRLLSPRGARGQFQNEIDAHNLVFVICIPHLEKQEVAREMVLRKAVDLIFRGFFSSVSIRCDTAG